MHTTDLFQMLQMYNPIDITEQQNKVLMMQFIQTYENCFERSLEIGHITASAWLLNKHHTHALLTHHTKLNRWIQLGGHCDGERNVLAVALQEAQEESGINSIAPISHNIFDIDIHLIPENNKEKEHYHYDVRFLYAVTSDEQIVKNHESKELRWIGKNVNELPTSNESVVRMFRKWVTLY